MADIELLRLWAAVCEDLRRARAMLPVTLVENQGSAPQFDEWLDHNELELALDELELLGIDNAATPEFWQMLAAAAGRMGLTNHMERLTRRGHA